MDKKANPERPTFLFGNVGDLTARKNKLKLNFIGP